MSRLVPAVHLPLKLALERFRAGSDAKLAAAREANPAPSATATRVAAHTPHQGARPAGAPQARPAPASAAQPPDRGIAARGAPPRADESLSAAGRMMARLVPLPLGDAERGRALEQAVLTQLAGQAATDPRAVASELRGSLERSGLFYEAHLRAWNSGEFALEDLKREPQARIGPRVASVPAPAANDESPRVRDAEGLPREPYAASQAALPVPKELQRLVREQLATLETRTAVVPLVLWPEQEAMLSIAEEPVVREEGHAVRHAGERPWRATLQLDLPRLGAVAFTLSVHDERVRIEANAAAGASRAEFAARAPDLHGALRRNALVLERLEVAGDAL